MSDPMSVVGMEWEGSPPPLRLGTLPRRYGGDKLGFKPAVCGKGYCDNDAGLVGAITEAIDNYRKQKQRRKAEIEKKKEGLIETAKGVPAKKRILQWYHHAVLTNAGWSWHELRSLIERNSSGRVVFEEPEVHDERGTTFVRCAERSHLLYTVHFGRSRFPDAPTEGPDPSHLPYAFRELERWRNVYVKIGHENDDAGKLVKKKHFVLDSNGVMTHRYVTRAFLVYNLATMFELRLTPPGSETDPRDAQLYAHLLPATARRIGRSTMKIEHPTVVPVTGLEHQEPRYTGDSFANHADTFDIRRAASYEPDGLLNPDFTPYRTHGSTGSQFMPRIGYTVVNGYCATRTASDPMKRNERASMQVRNGSGPDQPYLSTAALLSDYKIIRANKGERFDDSAENLGVVLVDLSIAKLMGVEIINQHAVESDRFKIAYDRYFDKSDIIRLEREVATALIGLAKSGGWNEVLAVVRANASVEKADDVERLFGRLAGHLGDGASAGVLEELAQALADAGVSPRAVGVKDGDVDHLLRWGRVDVIRHIMALQGDRVDHRSMIKRSAASELEEYIASARKNREVLMDRIPLACVVGIKLNGDGGKWKDLASGAYKNLSAAVGSKNWVTVDEDVRKEMLEFVQGDYNQGFLRLKDMFRRTAELKRVEDFAGTKNVT